jgi:site-specific DNA-methyltransferase (adenine-specific)
MERVVHGDCLEEMKKLDDAIAQIVIADPPYNIGKDFGNNSDKQKMDEYLVWCDQWIAESLRVLKPNGTLFIYGFSEILALILPRVPENIHRRWIVWHYTNKTVPSLNFWQRSHESILVLWKDTRVFNRDSIREPYTESFVTGSAGKTRTATVGRFQKSGAETTVYTAHPLGALPRDVIKIPTLAGGGKERVNHPTQKPLLLCEKLLKSCMQQDGSLVVVPFAGSGSECVAAKMLGLSFIGYELNPEYISIINERLLSVTGPAETDTDKRHVNYWKNLKSFSSINYHDTQHAYYEANGASPEILQMVQLNSKKFGSVSENIIKELLNIGPRENTQHDGILDGKKVEIKVGRYLQWSTDCMWQHIEPDHDYEVLVCCLLTFTGWEIYTIDKECILSLIEKGTIKKQGKQGYLVRRSQIVEHLTQLN